VSQSYQHHVYHPVPTYIATIAAVAALLCYLGAWAFGWQTHEVAGVLLAFAVLTLSTISRLYTVKLQDRIILVEMQVRCARALAPGQDELLAHLGPKQITALRFASDEELGDLLQRAVNEQLSPDAIKRAVSHWKADLLRT
jgi:small-conductance mechanosensitive channel